MLKEIKNILFVNKNLCYFCRAEMDNKKPYICIDCYEKLEIVEREVEFKSPCMEKAYYFLFYNRFTREKIKEYKFSGKNYLYRPFGQIMVENIRKIELEKEIDIIFYIPSHRRKEAKRGYNQSKLLGKFISKSLNIPLSTGNLVKTRHTKDQSKLSRLDRIVNLRQVFKAKDPGEIKGKNILLVDDIITTGTTLKECSRVLIENGGKKVTGLTLTSTKN